MVVTGSRPLEWSDDARLLSGDWPRQLTLAL